VPHLLRPLRRVSLPIVGLLFAALLALAIAGLPRAQAIVGCRADPVVTLSNGAVIDLNLSINDTLSDVLHVHYTLHGPVGTSLVSVSYPDGTGAISDVEYVANDTLGNYDGDTVVTTGTKVGMTAYLSVLQLPISGGTPTPAAPAKGHSGQDLHVHLHIA
jgi:hypothetical protein